MPNFKLTFYKTVTFPDTRIKIYEARKHSKCTYKSRLNILTPRSCFI